MRGGAQDCYAKLRTDIRRRHAETPQGHSTRLWINSAETWGVTGGAGYRGEGSQKQC